MASRILVLAPSLFLFLAASAAGAGSRADEHAPIGVMGDHMHEKGEVMLSFRYMHMDMDGNRDGTGRVSDGDVRSRYGFPIVPTKMKMDMWMVGAMWAPSNDATLMAMVPVLYQTMDHRTPANSEFTTRTSGIGDIKAAALIRLWDSPDAMHHVHLNAGLSIPTGSTSEKDDTPAGRVRLPYPMQLGAGTWDAMPGLTYTGLAERYSWGAQGRARLPIGWNNQGWRRGNSWGITGWVARSWVHAFSTSLRLDFQDWRNIRGDDDDLNPNLVPTADPDRRAGKRLDLLLGANFVVPWGPLKGNRLAIEVGFPLYQHLDGPQLETDWLGWLGWQYAF